MVTVAPGSDRPGRWLWVEDDVLASIAVAASDVNRGDGDVKLLLAALKQMLPGLPCG